MEESMYNTLLYDVENSVATITINRPEASNAFSEETYGEITDAVYKSDENEDVKAIIITGAGKTFCAGGDVKYFAKMAETGEGISEEGVILTGEMVKSIKSISKPVISAVNGVAAGAGAGLALASDFLILGESSSLLPAFMQMALPGDTDLIYLLQQAIGSFRTTRHVMLNEPITAELAKDYGIAYDIVEDDAIVASAWKLAERLVNGPSKAIAYQKELLKEFFIPQVEVFNQKEAKVMHAASKTSDHKEAVSAFLEKRKPHFKGS